MRPSESSRAGRRAWLRSISASSPRASGSSVARVSWRASRIASPARPTSGPRGRPCRPGRGRAERRRGRRADPGGALQSALGPADPLRHRRLRYVEGVGDLRVVRPPTARRVSATWEAGARSGWQQQKSRKRVSSLSSVAAGAARRTSPPGGGDGRPRCGGRQRAAGSRPSPATRAVARRVLGPHPQRLQQRLLQRVLGGIEILARRTRPASTEDEGAQRASSSRRVDSSITPG